RANRYASGNDSICGCNLSGGWSLRGSVRETAGTALLRHRRLFPPGPFRRQARGFRPQVREQRQKFYVPVLRSGSGQLRPGRDLIYGAMPTVWAPPLHETRGLARPSVVDWRVRSAREEYLAMFTLIRLMCVVCVFAWPSLAITQEFPNRTMK